MNRSLAVDDDCSQRTLFAAPLCQGQHVEAHKPGTGYPQERTLQAAVIGSLWDLRNRTLCTDGTNHGTLNGALGSQFAARHYFPSPPLWSILWLQEAVARIFSLPQSALPFPHNWASPTPGVLVSWWVETAAHQGSVCFLLTHAPVCPNFVNMAIPCLVIFSCDPSQNRRQLQKSSDSDRAARLLEPDFLWEAIVVCRLLETMRVC